MPQAQKPFQYQIHQNKKIIVQSPTKTGTIQAWKHVLFSVTAGMETHF